MSHAYKILMIEDESNIRSFVEAILSANGFKVLTAVSRQDGMTMFHSHLPDLVLLDLGLPDGDGMTLIEKIRREHATPILVLSARATEPDKVQRWISVQMITLQSLSVLLSCWQGFVQRYAAINITRLHP